MTARSRRRDVLKQGAALGAALTLGASGGARAQSGSTVKPNKKKDEASSIPIRGMTVSCPMYGQVWGTPLMSGCLDELKGLGVSWVAIHPYASVKRDGSIRATPAEETGYLGRAAEYCQEAGINLFYKPHLAYWGSFKWRGDIRFDSEAGWARFFRAYRSFIVDQARFAEARKLPGFCVGIEYDQTLHRKEWNDVIEAVRAAYRGPVTYAANWDAVSRVPFWSKLDVIGVQGYFPLGRGAPDRASIQKGWSQPLGQLGALSKKLDKKVLFTELGYPRSRRAAEEPWKPDTDDDEPVLELRERLMDVALATLESQTWYQGAFWWKWMPGPSLFDRDFSMKDDEALRVLRRRWAAPKGSSQR